MRAWCDRRYSPVARSDNAILIRTGMTALMDLPIASILSARRTHGDGESFKGAEKEKGDIIDSRLSRP